MKGLVSYTLFGDQPVYTIGAIRNVEIWNSSEFDVNCRFYVGATVPGDVKHQLSRLGAEVVPVDRPEDQTACFWRYAALKDHTYDYMMFRDTDSRPYEREFYAIRDWLRSDKSCHLMRDHPFHAVPILAGLFGVKSDWQSAIGQALPAVIPDNWYETVNRVQSAENFKSNDFYQVDQWWLRQQVYPVMHNMIIAHDDFFSFERFRFKCPLPPRTNNDFLGEGFDEFENPRYPHHRQLLDQWPR